MQLYSSLLSIDHVMTSVLFAEWSHVRQKFVGYRLSIEDLLEQNLGRILRPVFFLAARETLQPFVLIISVSFRVYSHFNFFYVSSGLILFLAPLISMTWQCYLLDLHSMIYNARALLRVAYKQ
jgi:hypothetical protein